MGRPCGLGRGELEQALAELIACFPVYRTYIRPDTGGVECRDRAVVKERWPPPCTGSPASTRLRFE